MSQNRSIVIADDEPHVLRSLEFILKKAGYQVRTAANGQEALNLIEQAIPDLVFLDIQMPIMDGHTVCRTLREQEAYQDLHVIMITAKGQENARTQSIEAGANEFITKPYSPRKLLARVQEILGS